MSPEKRSLREAREDFPILKERVHGKPLVYLDSAATSQKPKIVIETLSKYYLETNANIHRGVHALSEKATQAYESARDLIHQFIGSREAREIIFVRGATEAVNLVASTYGRAHLQEGDEILISAMEHHSNIVPWQMLCTEKKAILRVIPMNERGELLFEEAIRLLTPKTKLLAITQVSNALGTVNPVHELIHEAKKRGIVTLIDGAQAVPHQKVNVQELGCDFYVFSGHKMYGPTGIGVLYGRAELLEKMPPYQGGGDMISRVSFSETTYNEIPYKFEAGTPDIAGVIGLGAAVRYLNELGMDAVQAYEHELLQYATEKLLALPKIRLIGTAAKKAGVVSFELEGVHPHDIGTILDQQGIAIRTGHHCAMPVMNFFKVPATARLSLGLYNHREDIDAVAKGLEQVRKVFHV